MANYAIKAHRLTKRYDSTLALDSLSFSVGQNRIIGLIGPNGAGKTTLIKILTTQLKPTSGKAYVLGHEVGKGSTEIRKRISLLPQEVKAHFYTLTPFEYIYHYLRMRGLKRQEAKEKAREAIREFNISYADKPMVELSGGMVRKALVAMVLSFDAELYFLDEPTVGLDPSARFELWQILREKTKSSTIFLTSHYIDEVSKVCDEVILLDKRILLQGEPEDIVKHYLPRFRKKVVLFEYADVGEYAVKKAGKYTFVYPESESELEELTESLISRGVPFKIEELTIEDLFLLGWSDD
ncbi:ABC transporter ATP-binding protein [Thermococcus bergensis]|jgi:ABC-2 type transport system ATP-binding protein|uniref:ABC transporter ATP-binding protein n=1 Tax=Thermococcus bergensis TaxID=2689387 RepID=UPI001CECD8C3|nr:ABC transporter ATP-binding protein [Thermococcus bergensis]MCA6213777.1 ABC transporter ATP-binding protein [Thermococcus bergensis]